MLALRGRQYIYFCWYLIFTKEIQTQCVRDPKLVLTILGEESQGVFESLKAHFGAVFCSRRHQARRQSEQIPCREADGRVRELDSKETEIEGS